jgi:hypothetical protein
VSDTTPEFEARVDERYRAMSADERVRIASSMYETARAIILASLPTGLTRRERRLELARRMYGDELPQAALVAHAEWQGAEPGTRK